MKKPLILITNDDGYTAPGITLLAEIAQEFGDVVVIAPDGPQSGQSSALTVTVPLRVILKDSRPGYKLYKTNGKPADCIKVGLNKILGQKPDLILSGINHGSNASLNVIYSGTMGAALEGAIVGIPAIGFSITTHSWEADFTEGIPYIKKIIEEVVENSLPEGVCLNVNLPENDISGIKVCRQSRGIWHKEFIENIDPRGQEYFWLTGKYLNTEPESTDTDIWALDNGYVSIVPTRCDLTDYAYLEELNKNYENEG
ncbi:5'-nucleotidase /3'-nucleotidase /exopolyphosphatase [Balneicella halophila]|uniref:5'-nucleotidase SurE n=1 Tax=Balneicella halophila TaxID=1537566 RepID=A0A7L4UTC9_BALHA|nr:5'/3'-nucleotidase SurE [Balneicella halophila]PVX52617.1 5'-nucleotidase /3'-nucleotidase /exopolyphosphatase [Balneicella halophila]